MKQIFTDNKYTRWYYAIIKKRAILDQDVKGEVHHIIPRSLGGDDDPDNLVKLRGHDHAWCHWLLTKMTTGTAKSSMVYAFNMMSVYGDHMERQASYAIVRAYERNREEWSRVHSERMSGRDPWNKGKKETRPEVLSRIKQACAKRPPRSAESKAANAEKQRGQKRSEETRQKMSISATGKKKGPMSEEHKSSISQSMKGHKKSSEHGHRVAAANRGVVSINKDGVEKKIKKDDLQSWLDQGWERGGKKRS